MRCCICAVRLRVPDLDQAPAVLRAETIPALKRQMDRAINQQKKPNVKAAVQRELFKLILPQPSLTCRGVGAVV